MAELKYFVICDPREEAKTCLKFLFISVLGTETRLDFGKDQLRTQHKIMMMVTSPKIHDTNICNAS